jgi:hypothetical protein
MAGRRRRAACAAAADEDAFDGLSDDHQQIIASLQVGVPGSPPPTSVDDYRARLESDLNRPGARRTRRHRHPLARGSGPPGRNGARRNGPAAVAPTPEMAPAINAYAKAKR